MAFVTSVPIPFPIPIPKSRFQCRGLHMAIVNQLTDDQYRYLETNLLNQICELYF